MNVEDQRSAIMDLIMTECRRQEELGFSADHDDEHRNGELSAAAATYAMIAEFAQCSVDGGASLVEVRWPWNNRCPVAGSIDPQTALVRAGALIVAELARMMRIPK